MRFRREYLEYHQVSEARAREVIGHLRTLESRASAPADQVGADVLRAYVAELGKVRKATTIGKILGQIRPFFQWAWEARLIDAERLMEIKAVKAPRGANAAGVPNPYSRVEVAKMWSDWGRRYRLAEDVEQMYWYIERWERGISPWSRVKPLAWRLQSRAIISLALMGGLRREEIYRLTATQLHHDNAYITVPGARKNHAAEIKERPVPWTTPELRDAVREWLELRDRIVPGHDAPWLSLFSVRHIRTPLPFDNFEMLLTRMGRGWEYHRMRHTAATEMLRSGYPLETVKEIMGHSRIQQTLAYTQLLSEDVIRVAGRCEMQMSTALAATAA